MYMMVVVVVVIVLVAMVELDVVEMTILVANQTRHAACAVAGSKHQRSGVLRIPEEQDLGGAFQHCR